MVGRWILRLNLNAEPSFALCCRGMKKGRILVIEDDLSLAGSLRRVLESEEYAVELFGTADEGIARVLQADSRKNGAPIDVVVTDLQLPGKNGLEVITTLHPVRPDLPIILMTGHHTTEIAIEAIKSGAYDYVLKPPNFGDFVALIEKAL